MSGYSKKARTHAAQSKKRKERMLREAVRRSGPVTVSYLPGFEPPAPPTTKFPFTAIINGHPYTVTETDITRQED